MALKRLRLVKEKIKSHLYRMDCIGYYVGGLLKILAPILLVPLLLVIYYWREPAEGINTLWAFLVPAFLSYLLGALLQSRNVVVPLDMTASMLLCGLSWLAFSAVGALPFVFGIGANYLDAYFEAMSGFTTTGITVFSGLDVMPRSIIFWRALTQWLGGIGILSFFLAITFRGSGAHFIFGAESHKISSGRPAPGLYNTVKILWGIYTLFTVLSIIALTMAGMPFFSSVCHSFTALSTGGFSPHDASIEHYRLAGYSHYRLIEYILIFFMMLGGINFLVHYRVLTRDIKALWDNLEIRYWWGLLAGFTLLIMIDHLHRTGFFAELYANGIGLDLVHLEEVFRLTLFQVVSVLTTTGFGTRDIGSDFFPALSKQLFLVMMVIGGCVGSTGGGIKVQRVAVLNRLMRRELFRLRAPRQASSGVIVDKRLVPENEVHRIAALFFFWLLLLVVGGGITAFFSNHDGFASFSGMFSALGNIGPCYIAVPDMITIHPIVKLTYIFGMLAGRLELLPVLLLFSRKAWK